MSDDTWGSSKVKRVGVDMDGVVSDFCSAYAEIITDLTGFQFPDYSKVEPEVWYWEREAGVERGRENEAWRKIKSSHTFWLDLGAKEGAHEFLWKLSQTDHEVYFVTNRAGINVIDQTRLWLKWNGYQGKEPNVLLSRCKGLAAAALELDCYIDDKWENVKDCETDSPETRAYLLNKPYNRCLGNHDVRERVNSLSEFAEKEGLFS